MVIDIFYSNGFNYSVDIYISCSAILTVNATFTVHHKAYIFPTRLYIFIYIKSLLQIITLTVVTLMFNY